MLQSCWHYQHQLPISSILLITPTILVQPTNSFKYIFSVCNTKMESELLKTIQSNKLSADLLYKNKFYTQATTLYFKTLFSVCDYVILKSTGNAPKSHVER